MKNASRRIPGKDEPGIGNVAWPMIELQDAIALPLVGSKIDANKLTDFKCYSETWSGETSQRDGRGDELHAAQHKLTLRRFQASS